jgi:exopolyphosphatase/guanosine-5'-triphosphate,3'-diphosphate pyrophosphatase
MKVAALDLGTNSFLCLIAEIENGKISKIYQDLVRVVRLGQDVNKTKKFHPEALARAKICLRDFSQVIKKENPERVLAMATSAAREVTNADELFKIGIEFQIPIEIIPGGREAEITFLGATSNLNNDHKNRLIIDVGGGSTEYILGCDHRVKLSQSVDIGCVRLTESHISAQPTLAAEIEALEETILNRSNEILSKIRTEQIDEIIAVAGTPSAIAAIELGGFDNEVVDGYVLSKKALQKWAQIFSLMSVGEKINKYKIEKGRADVIMAGTFILLKSLEALGRESLLVSTKGVRYGVALEVAGRSGVLN